MDVILTNPCGQTGEIVRERLEQHGLSVFVMTGPSARNDATGYLRNLHRVVQQNGAKMIMPIFFPELLAAHKDDFPGIIIPLDSYEKIIQLDNKLSACQLISELGILQAEIYSCADELTSFPVVFRRTKGQGGDSVYFPRNRKALDNLLKNSEDAIITRFIEGYNVSVDSLRYGDFFFGSAYRTLLPKGKGVSILRESIDAPELVAISRRILESIDYQGVCGVDFRIADSDGKAYFLECNPRFSGGIESAIKSGFDIPYLLWRLASGEKVSAGEISYTSGILSGSATIYTDKPQPKLQEKSDSGLSLP